MGGLSNEKGTKMDGKKPEMEAVSNKRGGGKGAVPAFLCAA